MNTKWSIIVLQIWKKTMQKQLIFIKLCDIWYNYIMLNMNAYFCIDIIKSNKSELYSF